MHTYTPAFDVVTKVLLPLLPAAAATFLVMPGLTVKLQDTDCGHANSADTEAGSPLQFCKVCGGPQKVARACLDDSDCAGFVMDDESCGYLKASVAVSVQAVNATATLYCMAGTQGCEGGLQTAEVDFTLLGDSEYQYTPIGI